jgi:hypothetical protein
VSGEERMKNMEDFYFIWDGYQCRIVGAVMKFVGSWFQCTCDGLTEMYLISKETMLRLLASPFMP